MDVVYGTGKKTFASSSPAPRAAKGSSPSKSAMGFAKPGSTAPLRCSTVHADKALGASLCGLSAQAKRALRKDMLFAMPTKEPYDVEAQVSKLRQKIMSIPHKPAFDIANKTNHDYVHDSKFLLMFLRARRFDIDAAAKTVVQHFELKREIWDDAKLAKPITMADLSKTEETTFAKDGSLQVLPVRDSSGRAVYFLHGKESSERCTSVLNNTPQYSARTLWYYMMAIMERDDDTQKNGMVFITYALGMSTDGSDVERELWWNRCKAIAGIPVRTAAFHFCYNNEKLVSIIDLVVSGLDEPTRRRFNVVYGDEGACHRHLKTHGISSNALPVPSARGDSIPGAKQLGGPAPNGGSQYLTQEFCRWRRRQKKIEINPNVYTDGISILRRTDIVLEKGRVYHDHHWSSNLKDQVREVVATLEGRLEGGAEAEQHYDAAIVVHELEARGARFLEKRDKEGLWHFAGFETAERKVHNLLQHPLDRITDRSATVNKQDGESLEKPAPIPIQISPQPRPQPQPQHRSGMQSMEMQTDDANDAAPDGRQWAYTESVEVQTQMKNAMAQSRMASPQGWAMVSNLRTSEGGDVPAPANFAQDPPQPKDATPAVGFRTGTSAKVPSRNARHTVHHFQSGETFFSVSSNQASDASEDVVMKHFISQYPPATKPAATTEAMDITPAKVDLTMLDIACGRGRSLRAHPGNLHLNAILETRLDEYNAATEQGQEVLVDMIIKELDSQGRRFLKKVDSSGGPTWVHLTKGEAAIKISLEFRHKRRDASG